jgi:hypothetical protein
VSFCELGDAGCGAGVPDGIGGLAAVDCSPDRVGFCAAGASGALWHFHDDHFDAQPALKYDASDRGAQYAAGFRFRVRKVRFLPGEHHLVALAVTSGCCASDAQQDVPEVLAFDGAKWYVNSSPAGDAAAAGYGGGALADSLFAIGRAYTGGGSCGIVDLLATPGGPSGHYPAGEPRWSILGASAGVPPCAVTSPPAPGGSHTSDWGQVFEAQYQRRAHRRRRAGRSSGACFGLGGGVDGLLGSGRRGHHRPVG